MFKGSQRIISAPCVSIFASSRALNIAVLLARFEVSLIVHARPRHVRCSGSLVACSSSLPSTGSKVHPHSARWTGALRVSCVCCPASATCPLGSAASLHAPYGARLVVCCGCVRCISCLSPEPSAIRRSPRSERPSIHPQASSRHKHNITSFALSALQASPPRFETSKSERSALVRGVAQVQRGASCAVSDRRCVAHHKSLMRQASYTWNFRSCAVRLPTGHLPQYDA